MPSLTPSHREEEVSNEAFKEGLVNGLFTLIPTTGAMYIALKQSPWLRRSTNMQSRTALCIMPALFVFGFTSEEKVVHKMREIAKENQHSHDSVKWAERQLTKVNNTNVNANNGLHQKELTDLYRRAVYESGVRVIPGDRLSLHHIAANYVAENPIKVLGSLMVPGVAWIFYGRTGKEHLTLSMKIMHTRVFGQFATISMLLSIFGFKEFMDRNGRFITEAQAEARVEEMQLLRTQMLQRLEASNQAQQAYQDAIQKAHEEDVQEGHAVEHKKVHHNKNNKAVAMAVSPKV